VDFIVEDKDLMKRLVLREKYGAECSFKMFTLLTEVELKAPIDENRHFTTHCSTLLARLQRSTRLKHLEYTVGYIDSPRR